MTEILSSVNSPDDLKALSLEDLAILAEELRETIIKVSAANGGHLAPSLGVVELTIALHRVFSTPTDKILWDVGHQAYAHKLLTGRRDNFPTLRKLGGMSGFPKRAESPHDAFDAGHSSTSISAALGFAAARDLKHENNKVIAVIGDGSMTGGLAYEGLNHAGHLNKDLIVILNDNEMSIAENVGALSNFMSRTMTNDFVHRIKKDLQGFLEGLDGVGQSVLHVARKAEESLKGLFTPNMLFQAFGFEYIGPIDGHNLERLISTLKNVKRFDNAVLIHVLTKKGKGYLPAEENPSLFHGIGPFDLETGRARSSKGGTSSYTALFGETLQQIAGEDEKIIAITAAMPEGTGLSGFAREFPARFFDVGISEQHAVTFAAGLAAEGFRPVFAIYSTFLQRAYDEVFDVCLQNLPVTFAIDRAGVVGNDGPTHHGLFDLSYLRTFPNMVVMAPKDENELRHMLATAIQHDGPISVRYPRGTGLGVPLDQSLFPLEIGRGEILREGEQGAILALGTMVNPSLLAAERLAAEGLSFSVMNARFVKPLDHDCILDLARRTGVIITVEENVLEGGFGTAVLELLAEEGLEEVRVRRLGFPDHYIEQGEQAELRAMYCLDTDGILLKIKEFMGY
ncbi:MAG: 1-deoxy-D-xylulose-5-phosphate synthase [Deltaproteobacteria bacterium]|nr:1-deoxy-D-xylulose-5-phosphate synthase [Deltaproteobacteria bacterium]TLN04521.1 MAG: 1-deoxy-D-xylulose-5-phosphate synthase [bacterium]